MGELLYNIMVGVDWAEGIQILFLMFILWVARKARISNGDIEQRIKDTIDEGITRLDQRIEKRAQRQAQTNPGQVILPPSGEEAEEFPKVNW